MIELLKPCPFCGGKSVETERDGCCSNDKWFQIVCSDCGAMIQEYPDQRWLILTTGEYSMSKEQEQINFDNAKELIRQKWNKRSN